MALTSTASITSAEEFGRVRSLQGVEADNLQAFAGAVSWGAILAGARGPALAAISLRLEPETKVRIHRYNGRASSYVKTACVPVR